MKAPGPEQTLRWGFTLTALTALVMLAVTLSVTVAPALAWGVVLAVSAAVAVALWRRHLDDRQTRQDVDEALRRMVPPDTGRY